MISLLKSFLAARPAGPSALAATKPEARTAQPLSAEPGSGLLVPYRHVGWCGFCGFDPCRCQTPDRARWAGLF